MAKKLELAYPLYLDVPMMTSFLAALEDGVAYGADVTRKQERQKTAGAEGEGKVGIPTIPILSTLLNFDLRGKITENTAAGSTEEIKLVRKHTEASLFMGLRHTLKSSNLVKKVSTREDLNELEHADLVEVTGQIFRSPLGEFLEAFMRLLNLFGIEIQGNDASNQSKSAKHLTQSKPQPKNIQPINTQINPLQKIEQLTSDPQSAFALKMLDRMREDLMHSKIIDVVMAPVASADFEVVIALSTEFLLESTLQTLLSGEFTVLGKITRVLAENDEINLYQRTTFSYVDSQAFNPLFEGLRQQQFFKLPESSSVVAYPAIQLIPLAIFV